MAQSAVFYLALGAVVAAPLYLVWIYNQLILAQNYVREGWSGVDVQLRRRADLIPNLVETVKGYVAHERGLLEDLTRARTAALSGVGAERAGQASGDFSQALGRLFAVAENYPDLKADANFRELQSQLSSIEDALQSARRYYNGAVRRLNTLVGQFPSNMIARRFAIGEAEFFEIGEPGDRATPKVAFP
jgi:LemA protein